ncbi:MAG: flippase [Bacteroidales bacterium]|jgi:PST family polysaccharide transporter|nr:flippase [Bacteroidales bacterium]
MKNNFIQNNFIYIKNTFFLFSDNISKLILGFGISIFIARHLGPGRFGQINYVMSYISIFQIIVLFGFDNIAIKDLGLCVYPESTIIGTIIKFRFVLALIIYFLGLLLFFFIDRSLLLLYIILALQLFPSAFLILKQWFQIKSLNKFVVISSQISLFLTSIGKIVFVISRSSIFVYAIILLVGYIVEIISLYIFFIKKANIVIMKFNFIYFRALFKNSLPLLVSAFFVVILMKGSQILIGYMLSPSDLGIYSIGLTIAEIIFFIPTGIITAMYPKISKAKRENGNTCDLIVKVGGISVFFSLVFALICTFAMPMFVKIVYGDAYIDAGKIVQICGWVSVFIALGTNHSCFLIFENLQKYDMYAAVLGAGINIILGYSLIKQFGVNGAAIAFLIAHIFTNYLFFPFFKDKRSFVLRTRSLFFFLNSKEIFKAVKSLWIR